MEHSEGLSHNSPANLLYLIIEMVPTFVKPTDRKTILTATTGAHRLTMVKTLLLSAETSTKTYQSQFASTNYMQ